MGAGQSSAAITEHIQRWEAAFAELDQVVQANRRLVDSDRIYGNGMNAGAKEGDASRTGDREDEVSERSMRGARRPSSLVSFNHQNNTDPSVAASNSNLALHPSRPRGTQATTDIRQSESKAGFSFSNLGGAGGQASEGVNRSIGSASNHPRHHRQQVLELRKSRMALFKSYEVSHPDELVGLMECSHFGAAAVALSYLLGGHKGCKDRRLCVTVEDIFFAAQVPLHMLHTSAPHMAIMADILREFVDVDNRFKEEYSLETLHLDVSPTVGQVDLGPNEVGDRQTRMQLPEFRKLITRDCEEESHVIRIVNFDPYVLEQEMLVDAYEDGEERNSPLATSVLGNHHPKQQWYSPNNEGAYAVIVDVRNAVQLMVTIAEGVVSDSLNVKLREVSAAALFKAMMAAEEGRRARGFIRIFKKDSVPEFTTDEIPLLWTPELCSGKVLGTTREGASVSVISHHISPHIVGVAWAMHLLGGVRADTHGYGNGLPVSDIIRTMELPQEVFLQGSMSLDQVYDYAESYIKRTNRPYVVNLYPVLTKICREDAVPTISVFDLETILIDVKNANPDPEAPAHVMVIMYNANVAHNVIHIADHPEWCVLAGYDTESQTALLVDARPKTFSRSWSCPLDRLHKAMTGNGYMVFSKVGTSAPSGGPGSVPNVSSVGAPRQMAPMVQTRLQLLQRQNDMSRGGAAPSVVQTFRYPSLPVMPTIIAMACCKLGVFTTFEDVIRVVPFEISSLINRIFTLESLHVCLTNFLYFRDLRSQIQVQAYHGEFDNSNVCQCPIDIFTSLVAAAVKDEKKVLIVHFDAERLQIHGVCHPFGQLGIVVGFDSTAESVSVCDGNPNSYLRTWSVPLQHLHDAIVDLECTAAHNRRGCLMLTAGESTAEPFPAEYTRPYSLALLPVQNMFHVSPSPHFQGMSFAFAQLGFFFSPEEIFYEAYLKTMDDQRRRGSQAFAWRDVAVSLTVINKQIDTAFMAQVCNMFLQSRNHKRHKSSNAQGKEHRPDGPRDGAANASLADTHLVVEQVLDVGIDNLDELLKDATRADHNNTVLLFNFDSGRTHNLLNFGRSVALVKSYNPEKQVLELWNAEYAVFGLSWTVTVEQAIEMGDLNNDGRSPFGFVRFTMLDGPAQPKKSVRLMRAPRNAEEEAELDASSDG